MLKGLKLRKNNLNLIERYNNLYDFFEIYIDPKFPLAKLKKYSHKNITIHAAHFEDNFDPSNIALNKISKSIINLAIKAADIVNSPWIIVHPGHDLSRESKHNMLKFFDQNFDKRIIFENCPAIDNTENGLKYLFSLPEEIKFLIKRYNTGFVLDFGHAICTANVLNLNINEIIEKFINIKPKCFHISGINLNSIQDTHLHLFETQNNMVYLKNIQQNKYVTFETPSEDLKNISLQKKDIAFLNNILQK